MRERQREKESEYEVEVEWGCVFEEHGVVYLRSFLMCAFLCAHAGKAGDETGVCV